MTTHTESALDAIDRVLEDNNPDTPQQAWADHQTRTGSNIHRVNITPKRITCTNMCAGTEPHISEHRAPDVHGG